MKPISRKIQYRYLNRSVSGLEEQMTLYDALCKAMEVNRGDDTVGEVARARIADLEQSGKLTLLNTIQGYKWEQTAFSGELILYRQGFDVPAIEELKHKETNRFNIKQFQTDGISKPIEGILYFVIINDHLGIIQSATVKGRLLERYLTWLLKDICQLIKGEERIELQTKINASSIENAMEEPQIAVIRPSSVFAGVMTQVSELVKETTAKGGTVLNILKELGTPDDALDKLLKDVPKDGALEGDFKFYIKQGRRRKAFSTGTLDAIFRNLDTEDFDVIGKEGKLSGGSLALFEEVKVKTNQSSLDPEDAIEKIVNQLTRWSEQGRINLESK